MRYYLYSAWHIGRALGEFVRCMNQLKALLTYPPVIDLSEKHVTLTSPNTAGLNLGTVAFSSSPLLATVEHLPAVLLLAAAAAAAHSLNCPDLEAYFPCIKTRLSLL